MKKVFVFMLFMGICFILSGCINNSENKNGGEELIPIDKEIVEKLSATKKIIIYNGNLENNDILKTITNENEIEEIINIISLANKRTETSGYITADGSSWNFVLYDIEDKIISKIWVWKTGYVGFENDKEYVVDREALLKIIEN